MIRQRSGTESISRRAAAAGPGTCDGCGSGGTYCCGTLGPGRRITISFSGSRSGGVLSSASATAEKSASAAALQARADILLVRVVEGGLRTLDVAKAHAHWGERIGAYR